MSRGTAAMPMSGVRVIGIGIDNVLSQFIACGEQYVCDDDECDDSMLAAMERTEWNGGECE